MSCVLTKGRTNPCNDNVGGIKNLYFFKYIQYAYTQITGTRGVELLTFPETETYKWEANNAIFDENLQQDDNGYFYNQTLTFDLPKYELTTSNVLFDQMSKVDLRYIVEYYNGNVRMGGLWNGARLENYSILSGGSKRDFNGFRVTINGKEEYPAAFMAGVNIPDITSAREEYIFQDGMEFIFQDGNEYIFN